MRMITACCARALQKCTGRPYMGFLLICQIFRPTEKTRNQLLENKIFWLEGMFGKVIFQLEEWMEPVAVTCENGRSVVEYSEGSFFSFHFRHGLSFL